jgi:DNA helicase-2/ATP-dependent DNA helicase PcrA
LSGKSGQAVNAFIRLIQGLRQDCEGLSLAETVQLVIERSGLKAHFEGEREGRERLENLDELHNAAAGFDAETFARSQPEDDVGGEALATAGHDAAFGALNDFLAHAALEAGEHQAGPGQPALQLMTVHSAKGLEFDAVFISGLEEGLFPHDNSLDEADGVEEERRLMYVALTRARRRLYLTNAQTRILHGQTRYNIASRFLTEIPGQLVQRVDRVSVHAGFASSVYGEASAASRWRVGQDVVHPKFGAGVIVSMQGRGADARVLVNFGRQGMKELALEYARLAPA